MGKPKKGYNKPKVEVAELGETEQVTNDPDGMGTVQAKVPEVQENHEALTVEVEKPSKPKGDPKNGPHKNEKGETLWFRSIAASNTSRAVVLAQISDLKSKGFESVWLQASVIDRTQWYRAIVASHTTRKPAQALVNKLLSLGYTGAWLQAVYLP